MVPPTKREAPRTPNAVQGKTLMIGVLGSIMAVAGLLFWVGLSGGSTHLPVGKPGVGFRADPAEDAATAPSPKASPSGDGGTTR